MQIRSEIAYNKQNSLPGDKAGERSNRTARGIALAYYHRYTTDPESVKALPNDEAWLASSERVDENIRYLSVHRGHIRDRLEIVVVIGVCVTLRWREPDSNHRYRSCERVSRLLPNADAGPISWRGH